MNVISRYLPHRVRLCWATVPWVPFLGFWVPWVRWCGAQVDNDPFSHNRTTSTLRRRRATSGAFCDESNCYVTVLVSGVGNELNSICRYSKYDFIKLYSDVQSNCTVSKVQYLWAVHWLHGTDNKTPSENNIVKLAQLDHSSSTFAVGIANSLRIEASDKGIFAIRLKVTAVLEQTNINMEFLGYHLMYICTSVNKLCKWIRDQMLLLHITTPLQETKLCSTVSTRFTNIYSTSPVKLLSTSSKTVTDQLIRQEIVHGCDCTISPGLGYSLGSKFNLTCDVDMTGSQSLVRYKAYTNLSSYDQSVTIPSSTTPTWTSLYLHEGLKSMDYIYHIIVYVVSSTSVETIGLCSETKVQVFPASMNTIGSVKETINNLIGETIDSNNSVVDSLLNSGQYSSAVNILGAITSNLNAEINSNSTSRDENKQIREVIVSNLNKVTVSSLDDLDLVTDVLNLATAVPEELTEYSQNTALNMYSNLTDVFKDKASPTEKTRGEKSVVLLLDGLSSMLDVNTDKGTEFMISDQTNEIELTKVKQTSNRILTLVDYIADAAITIIGPSDKPTVFVTKYMTLAVMKSSSESILGLSLANSRSDNGKNSSGLFLLPNDTRFSEVLMNTSKDISIQMTLIDKNPYVWDESGPAVTTPVLSFRIKDNYSVEVPVNQLTEPVYIQISNQAVTQTTIYNLVIPLEVVNGSIMIKKTNRTLLRLVVNQTEGRSFIMTAKDQMQELQFEVYSHPVSNESEIDIKNGTLLSGDNNFTFISRQAVEDGLFYTYIVPVLDIEANSSLSTSCLNGTLCQDINLTIIVETYSAACMYWNSTEEIWSTDGCQVSQLTTKDTIYCECTHLSSFSGSFIVLPNFIDPFADAALFLTFFDNPIVVCSVAAIWFLYFTAVYWARKADQTDEGQIGIVVLSDANPEDPYQYLMCVVTGWWAGAETTAKVSCYLTGDKGQSFKHCLSDSVIGKACFKAGWEDWFLMTSSHNLGDLQSVTIWHDNSGTSPSWFLTRILIQDLRTNKIYQFLYGDWVGIERGFTKVTLPCSKPEDFHLHKNQDFLLKTSRDLRDGHLWLSIFSKPCRSNFTRVQRLTCCLSLLLCTMLTSIMFHGIPTDDPSDQAQIVNFSFSLTGLVIGIECGLIMFPINLIIVQLFMRAAVRPKKLKNQETVYQFGFYKRNQSSKDLRQNRDDQEKLIKEKKKKQKQPIMLPWWFIFITWCIALTVSLVSSYFVMLYGLKYGYQKSVEWLVSFFTAFFESAFLEQPIKVLAIAMILTYIFKKPVEIEGIKCDINLNDAVEKDIDYEEPQHAIPEPASKRLLQQIKQKLYMEELIEERLREIILYFMFVTIALIVVHGHRNITTSFYCSNTLEDIFIRKSFDNNPLGITDINSVPLFWKYLKVKVLPGLSDIYNGNKSEESPGSDFYLVGPFRFRQLRINKGTCPTPDTIKTMFSITVDCSDIYWLGNEDKGHYNQTWNTRLTTELVPHDKWSYRTAWDLGTIPYTGSLSTYGGGGYVLEMTPNDRTDQTIEDLKSESWIDDRTRALFIEFTLYNPNVNLFSAVMLLFEFSNNGGIFPFYQIFTTKLYNYGNGTEIAVAFCEVLFLVFTIMFTYFEIKRVKGCGYKQYFSSFWNTIEFILVCICYSIIGLFIQRLVSISLIMKRFKADKTKFVSFYTAISWDFVQMYLMGFLVFIVIMKFLKILSFNQNMHLLSNTLKNAKKSLCGYVLYIFILIFSFAHFTLIAFGAVLNDYKGLPDCLVTLFNFALYKSDFYGLWNVQRILGPVFYVAYVFLILFIYTTVFMAIVNESITQTRQEKMKKLNELEVVNYLVTKLSHILPVELAIKLK